MTLKPDKKHWIHKCQELCSNCDPESTLAFFGKANIACVWENAITQDFLELVEDFDINNKSW